MWVLTNTNLTNLTTSWYKERESPMVHINEVSKTIGEQGRLQVYSRPLQVKYPIGGVLINLEFKPRHQR